MVSCKVVVKRDAEKELRALPHADVERIVERIKSLASNPRPFGSEKLSALERYRIRQGRWRVLYEIDDGAKVVTVVKVAHRREVYR